MSESEFWQPLDQQAVNDKGEPYFVPIPADQHARVGIHEGKLYKDGKLVAEPEDLGLPISAGTARESFTIIDEFTDGTAERRTIKIDPFKAEPMPPGVYPEIPGERVGDWYRFSLHPHGECWMTKDTHDAMVRALGGNPAPDEPVVVEGKK